MTAKQAAALSGLTLQQIQTAADRYPARETAALRATRGVNGRINITTADLAEYLLARRKRAGLARAREGA